MWYSQDKGPWILFSTRSNIDPGDSTHYGQLDVGKLPRGDYRIKVDVFAPDAIDEKRLRPRSPYVVKGSI
jgi:hypothetical protein